MKKELLTNLIKSHYIGKSAFNHWMEQLIKSLDDDGDIEYSKQLMEIYEKNSEMTTNPASKFIKYKKERVSEYILIPNISKKQHSKFHYLNSFKYLDTEKISLKDVGKILDEEVKMNGTCIPILSVKNLDIFVLETKEVK